MPEVGLQRSAPAGCGGLHQHFVVEVRAGRVAQGELEHGKFSYQLILDDGAQEIVIMPTADDAKVLRDLFHDADTIYWATEREVLIFGKID